MIHPERWRGTPALEKNLSPGERGTNLMLRPRRVAGEGGQAELAVRSCSNRQERDGAHHGFGHRILTHRRL